MVGTLEEVPSALERRVVPVWAVESDRTKANVYPIIKVAGSSHGRVLDRKKVNFADVCDKAIDKYMYANVCEKAVDEFVGVCDRTMDKFAKVCYCGIVGMVLCTCIAAIAYVKANKLVIE